MSMSPSRNQRLTSRAVSVEREPGGEATPPASPSAARRARDDDVFLRLTGAAPENAPQGTVKEVIPKRPNFVGSNVSGGSSWLQCTHVAEGHLGAAQALAATPHALYSGGVDRTVRSWDLSGGREAWRACCGGAVAALAADSRVVLAASGAAVKLFDTRTNGSSAVLWPSGAGGQNATAVTAMSLASATRLYTAAGDKLRLWDLRMLECVYKAWSGHAAAVMCLAREPLPSGDRLATGSRDHCVRVLDLQHNNGTWEACNRRQLEPPHYDGVQAVYLRGNFLYSASRDSSLKCWSLTDNTLTHSVMNAHKGWVTGLCAVGTGLASCGRDQALRLWSGTLRSAAPPASLPDVPHALAACPATHTLYTAGSGGEVRAWRLVSEP